MNSGSARALSKSTNSLAVAAHEWGARLPAAAMAVALWHAHEHSAPRKRRDLSTAVTGAGCCGQLQYTLFE